VSKRAQLLPGPSSLRDIVAEDVRPDLWLDTGAFALTQGSRWFDGVDQRFSLGTAVNPGTSDFWLSFWFYQQAFVASAFLFETGAYADNADGFYVFQVSASSLRIAVNDSVKATRTTTTWSVLAQREWIHFAINFDRDGLLTLYKNGVLSATTLDISGQAGSLGATHNGQFGAAANGTSPFNGRIACFGYGTGLLGTADVAALYHGGYPQLASELPAATLAKTVHYWNCAETDPTGALEDAIAANNGTAAGTSVSIALAGNPRKLASVNNTPCSDVYCRLNTRPTFRAPIPSARPTYLAAGIASRPALVFDGTADCLEAFNNLPTGTACEFAIVFKTGATAFAGRTQTLLAFADNAAANEYGRVGIDADGKCFIEVNNSGTTHKVTGSTVLSLENEYCLCGDSTGDAWSLRLVGAEEAETLAVTTANSGQWIGDLSGVDSVVIGALHTSGGYADYFEGSIAQVILCDVNKSERIATRIRSKVAGLYALTVVLGLMLADGTGILLSDGTGLVA